METNQTTRTPIAIDDIVEEWKKDSVIDESRISHEIIRTAMLHSKYLEHYVSFKRRLAAAEAKRNKLAWQKRKYFRGEMDLDDLKKNGWSQWNGLKPSAAELNQLLEFDSDMNDYNRAVSELKGAVSGCEYIMAAIKGREFALKTLYEYNRYLSGG